MSLWVDTNKKNSDRMSHQSQAHTYTAARMWRTRADITCQYPNQYILFSFFP